jgi:IS5 family transposase
MRFPLQLDLASYPAITRRDFDQARRAAYKEKLEAVLRTAVLEKHVQIEVRTRLSFLFCSVLFGWYIITRVAHARINDRSRAFARRCITATSVSRTAGKCPT